MTSDRTRTSFLLKPSMKPMRARSNSLQFSAALEHRETARRLLQKWRFRWTTECVLGAPTAITSTVPSAIWGKRLSMICFGGPLLETVMVHHLWFFGPQPQSSAAPQPPEAARWFAAERSFGSKAECAQEVQLATLSNSLPTMEKRDINDPLECQLLETVIVHHLRNLDKLECRGTVRRFATECDPVECVSAQRGGQS